MSSIPSASDSRLSSLLAKLSTSSDKPGSTDPSFLASDTRFVGGDTRFETILGTLDNVMSTAGSEVDDASFTGGERSFPVTGTSKNLYKLIRTPVDSTGSSFVSMCKGIVGQGVGFCTKIECDTKSHRFKKAVVRANYLYVLKQNGSVAFLEPCISGENVDEELLQELMTDKKTLSDWNNKFSIINKIDKIASKSSIEVEEFYFENMKAYKTPAKPSKSSVRGFSLLEVSPYKRQNYDSAGVDDDSEVAKIYDVLRGVDYGLEETSNLLIRVVANQDNIIEEKNKEFNSVSTKLQSLEDVVGRRIDEVHEDYQAPTIWGSVALLASHINTVNEAFCHIEPKIDKTFESVLNQSMKAAHSICNHKSSELSVNIEALKNALIASLESIASSKDRTEFEVKELRNDLNDIRNVKARTVPFMSNGGSMFSADSIHDELEQFKKVQDDLNVKMNSLAAKADKEAIKFCNLGFRTYQESAVWIDLHFPDHSFGLIMSMFTVLEHVHASFSGSPSLERLNQLYKLKINDLNKGLAITSFDSRWPKYFMKNQLVGAISNDQSFFDRVPSYEVWEEPQTGVRDRLKEELETFSQGYNRMITNALSAGSIAYTIAYNSVTTSISFIESLLVFIDDIYRELTRAKFSKTKAWALVTRLIRRIFMDIAVPRNSVQNQFRTGQDEIICKQIFWAEIQSLEIMNQFKAHAFKDHPAIASEYVKFLVTNTGIESLEKLVTKMSSIEEKINEMAKGVKAAITSSTTASNKADEMKKSMTDLLRRVVLLEKK